MSKKILSILIAFIIIGSSIGVVGFKYEQLRSAAHAQYIIDHNAVIFVNESGLPNGTTWSASIYPEQYGNGYSYQYFSNSTNGTSISMKGLTLGRDYTLAVNDAGRYYTHNSMPFTQENLTQNISVEFYPIVQATASYNVILNGTRYWLINDWTDGETNPGLLSVELYGGAPNITETPTTLAPPGQAQNQSAWVYMNWPFQVTSVVLSCNITGFSLNHTSPELPVNYTFNVSTNIELYVNTPDYPVSAHYTFTLVIKRTG